MSPQWYYMKDGENKVGPVSGAELLALVKSGELMPTDMVCKEGMAKWATASTIKGLFTSLDAAPKAPFYETEPETTEPVKFQNRPLPQRAADEGNAVVTIVGRLVLGLAVFASLLAVLFALLGFGGDVLSLILAILGMILGSIGVLFGLAAVVTGLSGHKGRTFMETAAIAVFLGIAALMFSIGSTLSARTIKEYRDIAAKAGEVEQERIKAETARREAKLLKTDAENIHFKALEEPDKILKEARELKKQTDETSDQLKSEQTALNKKRDEIDSEVKIKRAALTKAQNGLATLEADLADKRISVNKQEVELGKQAQELAKKTNQLKLDLKKPQELKDEAAKLRDEAEKKQREAKAALEESDVKEKAVKAYHKLIVDELKNVLKVKTKARINTIDRIGSLPRPASLDLSEINYELSEIVLRDEKLRQDALEAIFKIDRGLGGLATFFMNPPKLESPQQIVDKVNELPKYGVGGLPLIEGLLMQSGGIKARPHYGSWQIFQASVETLTILAKKGDDRALTMLTKTPKWSCAQAHEKFPYWHLHNRLFAMNEENMDPMAPSGWLDPRHTVGKKLVEVCKENPNAQKKTEVVDFFIDLLKERKADKVPASLTDENQILAAKTLASFRGDAKRALNQLKELRKDNSQEVRNAAEDAIQQIGEAK